MRRAPCHSSPCKAQNHSCDCCQRGQSRRPEADRSWAGRLGLLLYIGVALVLICGSLLGVSDGQSSPALEQGLTMVERVGGFALGYFAGAGTSHRGEPRSDGDAE